MYADYLSPAETATWIHEMEDLTQELQHTVGETYIVSLVDPGWIEVRVNPETALRDNLDFLRIVQDDEGYFSLYHFTHNEAQKGKMTINGSFSGYLHGLVGEFCEVTF